MFIGAIQSVLVITLAMGHVNGSPMGAPQHLVNDEQEAVKNTRSVTNQETCVDKDVNCATRKETFCEDSFLKDYMTLTCPLSCNRCPTSSPTAVCPESYSEVGETCYDHVNERVDYATAVSRCNQNNNGHLSMLEDGHKGQQFNEYIQGEVGERLNVTCHRAMDVVFLIDTSDSMDSEGLEKQILFIRSFVSNFDFGPGKHQSQFAVMDTSYSEAGDFVKIRLNDYDNAADFSNALTSVFPEFIGRGEFPYLALRDTRTDILRPENGARANVEKIVILISDGGFEYVPYLLAESELLKDADVRLFYLFVVNTDYAKAIINYYAETFDQVVSSPPEEHKFLMTHAADLTGKISTLVTEICWEKIEMWIGRTHDVAPTDDKGVMTTMNAAFTSGLRSKEEQHEFVCEADKVSVKK